MIYIVQESETIRGKGPCPPYAWIDIYSCEEYSDVRHVYNKRKEHTWNIRLICRDSKNEQKVILDIYYKGTI